MSQESFSSNTVSRLKERINDRLRIVEEGEVLEIGYYPAQFAAATLTAILFGFLVSVISQYFGLQISSQR